jgi:hypothetical protein
MEANTFEASRVAVPNATFPACKYASNVAVHPAPNTFCVRELTKVFIPKGVVLPTEVTQTSKIPAPVLVFDEVEARSCGMDPGGDPVPLMILVVKTVAGTGPAKTAHPAPQLSVTTATGAAPNPIDTETAFAELAANITARPAAATAGTLTKLLRFILSSTLTLAGSSMIKKAPIRDPVKHHYLDKHLIFGRSKPTNFVGK